MEDQRFRVQIEHDYFNQQPPDSEEKLLREFVLFAKTNVLEVDIVTKLGSFRDVKKKEFLLKERFYPGVRSIHNCQINRKDGEGKAKQIFDEFQREVWMENDGILSAALSNVEEEERTRCLFEDLAKRKELKRRQHEVEFTKQESNVEVVGNEQRAEFSNEHLGEGEGEFEENLNEACEVNSVVLSGTEDNNVQNEMNVDVLAGKVEFEDEDLQDELAQDSDTWVGRNLKSLLDGRLL